MARYITVALMISFVLIHILAISIPLQFIDVHFEGVESLVWTGVATAIGAFVIITEMLVVKEMIRK